MEIKINNGDVFAVSINGSVNSKTAVEFEEKVSSYDGAIDAVLDFEGLDYLSSAGLRVVLGMYKKAAPNQKSVSIININDEVRSVMEMTGFDSFIEIK